MGGERSGTEAGWTLVYTGFDPEERGRREALSTLGNGRFATRGAFADAAADDIHYPGTYLAGGYNRLTSRVAGREVENEDLVNLPNWLPVTFRPSGGRWFRWGGADILSHRVELHLRSGVLKRRTRIRDHEGRETTIRTQRIVDMSRPLVAALRYSITPENWSGPVELRSELDGSVENRGVERYRKLASRHLEVLDAGPMDPGGMQLTVRTLQSRLEVAVTARTRIFRAGERLHVPTRDLGGRQTVGQAVEVKAGQGEKLTLEKVVVLTTSRDRAISEARLEGRRRLGRLPDMDALLRDHRVEWETLWRRFDVEILRPPGEEAETDRTQLILRLHLFHLLQTCSHHTVDLDVGVPARGWHGEAYRGHIFWDEVFIHPLFNLHLPEVSRSLLLYRYRRLDAARFRAEAEGYRGALFPWQSGSDGSEETQLVHLNPRSGEWDPDHSRLQRHINAAVAYNVWQYHQTTGDLRFLRRYGAEMLLEIARFWSRAATWNERRRRWEIRGVMGPDEYQEKYPDAERGGVDNNAYTNVMAVWCVDTALKALELVGEPRRSELRGGLDLDDGELDRWRSLTERMFVPFLDEGVLEQFEGYRELAELDWAEYRARYGDIHRLDRILKAEGDTPDRYQASKQADATMLFYLLTEGELAELFRGLGYAWNRDLTHRTVEYYRRRTADGSTLSRVVYASVLNLVDPEEGWQLFQEALRSDIDDIQGGTTAEGIHLGAMAGTVDILLRRYAGIRMTSSEICFDPCCPPDRSGIRFRVEHQTQWVDVEVRPDELRLTLDPTAPDPVRVRVRTRSRSLSPGATERFSLE